jgi:RES domain-containing protein
MLTVWRLVTARFAQTAFSGEGAKRYGGRWNRKGVPMVYTSGSRSLAMLELLVQDNSLRAHYVAIPATIPPRVVIERVSPDDLPPDWRDPAARGQLQAIGTTWVRERRSAVLAVPSAVIPAEPNYLLNPFHPAFARIRIGEPEELATDLRLI